MNAVRQATSLVDFRALKREPERLRGGDLMRDVMKLLRMVSDHSSDTVLDAYDTVLLRLSGMVEPAVRAEIAADLARQRRVPPAIVRHLALDDIEIAQPLLILSPMLSDSDLCGIAEIRGVPHRRAIARRPLIGMAVTDLLILRGDDSVRRALAGNVTARISPAGYEKLAEQAKRDPAMRELLAVTPTEAAAPSTIGVMRKAVPAGAKPARRARVPKAG
ncbi:MAG: DUF2336 domain-containing protein [Bauldia sp.]|nr:DUF2336 domain-containing protein [Bauldia sp.]